MSIVTLASRGSEYLLYAAFAFFFSLEASQAQFILEDTENGSDQASVSCELSNASPFGIDACTQVDILGLTVLELSAEVRAMQNIDNLVSGLLIQGVDEDSEAFEKGLREGDLIVEAGQERVAELSDLEQAIESAKSAGRSSLLLLVRRGGDPRFVALGVRD